jgi:hypothetical protein
MATEQRIPRGLIFNKAVKRGWPLAWKLFKGRLAASLLDGLDFFRSYQHKASVRDRERLTPADMAQIVAYQSQEVGDSWGRRSSFQFDESLLSHRDQALPYQKAGLVCHDLLTAHPDQISSMANVGARVDIVSSFLAPRFPEVQFCSVDLQPELAKHNSLLPPSPNWSFLSGYALELFESGQLAADLVVFSSTACLFGHRELAAYCKAMAKRTKFVVINEPWEHAHKQINPLRLLLPEEMDPEAPLMAGSYNYYLHNYPHHLQQAGFEVLESQISAPRGAKGFFLTLVARNRNPLAAPKREDAPHA